jgi:hypothetical protein
VIKKTVKILLAIVIMISYIGYGSQPARAISGTVTRTQTLDVTNMETTRNDMEGWYWNREEKTLALNGLNIVTDEPYALRISSATIVINGINSVTSTYNKNDNTVTSGIFSMSSDLVFEGAGSLTATGGTSSSSYGIRITGSGFGSITINSGSIVAIGGSGTSASSSSGGVYTDDLIINGGSLTATGGNVQGGSSFAYSRGLYLYGGDLIVNNGILIATGGSLEPTYSSQMAGVFINGKNEIKLSEAVAITKPSNSIIQQCPEYTNGSKAIFSSLDKTKAAKSVVIGSSDVIEAPTTLSAPVISLDTGTKIREGMSTTVKWNNVPGASSYVISVMDIKTYDTYLIKETTATNYKLSSLPKGSYLIIAYAKDSYEYGSDLSNTIKLIIDNDEYIDHFKIPVTKTYMPTVEKGTVRHMCQTSKEAGYIDSPLYYKEYWTTSSGKLYTSKSECSTCCISMALSYLGLNYTPVDLYDVWGGTTTYFGSAFKDTKGDPVLHIKGASLSDFNTMYNNYSSDSNYSPVIVYLTRYGGSGSHYVLIVEKSDIKANTYIAVDPFAYSESQALFELTFEKDANGNDIIKYSSTKKENVLISSAVRFRQYHLQ